MARIDALFAEIEDGEAALADARKGLDTFRRALLKSAVTGELTKDCERGSTISNAQNLLNLISIKSEKEWQSAKPRFDRNHAPHPTTIFGAFQTFGMGHS